MSDIYHPGNQHGTEDTARRVGHSVTFDIASHVLREVSRISPANSSRRSEASTRQGSNQIGNLLSKPCAPFDDRIDYAHDFATRTFSHFCGSKLFTSCKRQRAIEGLRQEDT